MSAENDAPCESCGTANVTCFDGDGYCCAACCASHGMVHTRVTPPAEDA